MRLIAEIKPTEVYNLAAQSHVGISFDVPEYTAEATGNSTLKLLEAIRVNGGNCRFYQASTSELFGKVQEVEVGIADEYAFITDAVTEGDFAKKAEELGNVVSRIRVDF